MSSKCFIWIVHVLIYLWEFSWNFCDFRSTFRVFKQFLGFCWNCFRTGNKFWKNKIYSTWAEPEGPTQSAADPRPARQGPSGAQRGPTGQRTMAAAFGRTRPHKGAGPEATRAPAPRRHRPLLSCAPRETRRSLRPHADAVAAACRTEPSPVLT
jgi:hypothetical protein